MNNTKQHSVYQFIQTPCLAKESTYNKDQRAKANTNFEKVFSKLIMIIAFYEKMMEKLGFCKDLDLIDTTGTQKILRKQSGITFYDKTGECENFFKIN